MGFSGSGTISGSCDAKESTCTFLSRCLAYLWTSWGSWKTSLKIFVICTGWISAAWASGVSSIVLCRGIVRGDVTGRVCLCILENRRRQPESGFISYFLNCSRCQTKGFFSSDTRNNQVLFQLSTVVLPLLLLRELLEELAKRIHNLFFIMGGRLCRRE